MGKLGYSRAWLTAAIVSCLAWSALTIEVSAATLLSPGAAILVRKSVEPFGLSASPLPYGGLREKWLGVEHHLDDEMVQLALCDGDRERCASPAALQFLAIVDIGREREGRARLGEINRAINLAIRPMSDLAQYGEVDVWSSPLVTFAHGAGDCEDYAIAKYAALRMAGLAPEDLRIVIIRDTRRDEDHAIVAARLDGHWLTLDNRRMAMIEDDEIRNSRPTFVIDRDGVRRYQYPPEMAGTDRDLAPQPASYLAAWMPI